MASIEEEKLRGALAQLAAQPLLIPASGRETEFFDAISRLEAHHHAHQLSALIQKAKQKELSMDEKQQLQLLLEKKRECR